IAMKDLFLPLLFAPAALCAQQPGAFSTPLDATQLDTAAFTEWVDGASRPVEQKEGPRWILGLPKENIGHSGLKFGVSTNAGVRHLSIGFKAPVACGAVLVRGGGVLSVLRDGAVAPARLDDESQWLPATRVSRGNVGHDEVGADEFA